MITGLTIENFKGIREPVSLELRPLTLLFGPNFAGKSTFLHALQYARELFERHNLDPDRTVAGGEQTDLGGFLTLVNGHEPSRIVRIAIAIDHNEQLYEQLSYGFDMEIINEHLDLQNKINSYASELVSGEKCVVELAVSWNPFVGRPYISEYKLQVDGAPLASVTADASGRVVLSTLNLAHPGATTFRGWNMLSDLEKYDGPPFEDLFTDPDESVLSACLQETAAYFQQVTTRGVTGQENIFQPILLEGQEDALPQPGNSFQIALRDDTEEIAKHVDASQNPAQFAKAVASAIGHFLTVPLAIVTAELQRLRYLGPIRDLPSRHYRPPRFPDDARWASGLGAWDLLATGSDKLLEDTSEWLSSQSRLNSGYVIRRQRHKKVNLADPLLLKLQTGRAFDEANEEARMRLEDLPEESEIVIEPLGSNLALQPHDLGIGISQVVPVIVTALDGKGRLLAIEQPELHIHPRLQAEIGDLFVEEVHKLGQRFLIETHSEHLILRLQRRIRESSKGTAPDEQRLQSEDIVIYYVSQEQGSTRVRRIELDMNGEFVQPWPDDFFEIDFYERFGHAR